MTAEELAVKELELAKKEQEIMNKEKEALAKAAGIEEAKLAELAIKEQELLSKEQAFLAKANSTEDEKIAKLAQEKLDESLKDIKSKLDKAYSSRDDAFKKVAEFEQKEREQELKRLQDEGKHKEAYELQLAEEKAKREALEKRNVELTRDIEARSALSNHNFRNDNALEMAYKEIVSELVKNESGNWVHRSGASIREYVKQFSENADNAFLFKPVTSSGSGSNPTINTTANTTTTTKKSLFGMKQEDVLKMAAEGKFRKG
jgi:hypothetical protein